MLRNIVHWHLKLITFSHLSLIGFKECSLEDNFGDGILILKKGDNYIHFVEFL